MYFFVWLSTRSHTLNLQTYHLIIQQNHAIWSFYAILCFVKLFPFSYLWIKLSYCKVGVGDCCWLLRRMYLWLKQRRLSPFAKVELNINLLCGSFCLRWDFVSKEQKPYHNWPSQCSNYPRQEPILTAKNSEYFGSDTQMQINNYSQTTNAPSISGTIEWKIIVAIWLHKYVNINCFGHPYFWKKI